MPYLSQVETFPDGAILFDYCNRFGFEGIVQQAQGLALFERTKPQLGQDEVSGMGSASMPGGTSCLRVDASPS